MTGEGTDTSLERTTDSSEKRDPRSGMPFRCLPMRSYDAYLQLCEDRDLDSAARYLAPNARLQFPGNVVYEPLSDLVADSSGRYRWLRKHRERYLIGQEADGRSTVTSIGTLHGEDPDGAPFHGVRYVDVCPCRKPHPHSSGRMLVLVEDAAEPITAAYVEAADLVWIGDRFG